MSTESIRLARVTQNNIFRSKNKHHIRHVTQFAFAFDNMNVLNDFLSSANLSEGPYSKHDFICVNEYLGPTVTLINRSFMVTTQLVLGYLQMQYVFSSDCLLGTMQLACTSAFRPFKRNSHSNEFGSWNSYSTNANFGQLQYTLHLSAHFTCCSSDL